MNEKISIHRDPISPFFSWGRIAAALFFLLLFSALIIGYNIRGVNDEMANRLSHALQLAEKTLPPAIWQFNYDYLNNFAEALFLESRVVYVSVLTDGVSLITRSGPLYRDRDFSFFQKNSSWFETGAADIFYEGRVIAVAQMAFSREGIYAGMVANITGAIMLMAATLSVIMLYYARLKASERRFRTLYDNAVEGLFQTDTHGRFLRANPSMARMLGYRSLQELMESITDIEDQLYVYPEHRQEIIDRLEQEERIIGFETEARRNDGGRIWVSLSVRTERDSSGKILFYDGLMMDITERKAREQAERERQAAEASAKAKSEFLANMSHEIRTPMNAIMGLTDLVMKTRLNFQQQGYMKKIRASSHTLLGILNDILDFSKIEAGMLDLESVTFDLDELLENLFALFVDKAVGKSMPLHLKKGKGVPKQMKGDPLRLNQILVNLVSNAVKFTEQGSVTVTVDSEVETEKEIRLRFSVADTGIGIERSEMARLFDSFTQADGSTTRKYGGTGLGLAISKRLTEIMGGEIRAWSEPGRGSTFQCILPFGRVPVPGLLSDWAESEAVGPDPSLWGASVLLVEDNPINQEVALEILKDAGIDVTLAPNGKAALEAVARKRFDAVLMDVQMPEMDGYEATRRIKGMGASFPNGKSPPVIAMTAHAMKGDRERCFAAGMDDYVSKPIDMAQLFSALVRWIDPMPEREKKSPAQPEPLSSDIVDIDEATGRLSGRKALFLRLFTRFCREYADMGDRIRMALEEGDRERASQLSHEVKGVAGNLSANSLFSASSRLDKEIRTGVEDPKGSLKDFQRALDQVIAMGRHMEEAEAAPSPEIFPPDATDAEKQLNELGNLLSRNSPEAEERFFHVRGYLGHQGLSDAADRLGDQLNRFDFKGARKTFDTIARSLDRNPSS